MIAITALVNKLLKDNKHKHYYSFFISLFLRLTSVAGASGAREEASRVAHTALPLVVVHQLKYLPLTVRDALEHECVRVCEHTRKHTCTHTYSTYTHTYIHKVLHTYTYMYTCTHMYTHSKTQPYKASSFSLILFSPIPPSPPLPPSPPPPSPCGAPPPSSPPPPGTW